MITIRIAHSAGEMAKYQLPEARLKARHRVCFGYLTD